MSSVSTSSLIVYGRVAMKCVHSTLLILSLSYCNSLTYLCKTKETFKLAELQWLEVELNAMSSQEAKGDNEKKVEPYHVKKLLVDRATGSTLFQLDTFDEKCDGALFQEDQSLLSPTAPSSLQKCDWIAQVLVGTKDSAAALVQTLQEVAKDTKLLEIEKDWNLNYVRMDGAKDGETKNHPRQSATTYTKNSLLQAVAQALAVPPALDPKEAKQQLLLVDAFCDKDGRTTRQCYLGVIQERKDGESAFSNPLSILQDWSKRPFQYSSAINPQVAESIMDILWDMMLPFNSDNDDEEEAQLTLLDPTCGSGTFLALAMDRGMRIEAYDCNLQCVEGSKRNMEYLFSDTTADAMTDPQFLLQVSQHDSTNPLPITLTDSGHKIDCVIANLPWGINSSVDDDDQNVKILRSVRQRILPRTPCAFVTRSAEEMVDFGGFEVLGQAHVPQRGFLLPKGSKKKKGAKDLERNGRNQCVVTIVRAK
ncbi:unnamed protein product [Cylindrotheca closterium]|uniref:Uncharacterized protein n=1 Tax=Cylindrotheca closterium TaxID=2856 RepID=A0AAD2FFG2_9STRA|nr:unnamed protein product [Cylindrotheca closterium]